jgi:hypothetical protein
LSYFEAVNKETLKNSYQRFEEEGIIQVVKSKDKKIPPRLRLSPDWTPSRDAKTGHLLASGRIWDFTEKIASSRREGKNRRDGATVSTRVLGLSDLLGQKLYEEAISGETKNAAPARLSQEDAAVLKKTQRDSRRRNRLERRAHL